MEISPVILALAPFVLTIEIIFIVKEVRNHINNIKDKIRKKAPIDQTFKPFNFNR